MASSNFQIHALCSLRKAQAVENGVFAVGSRRSLSSFVHNAGHRSIYLQSVVSERCSGRWVGKGFPLKAVIRAAASKQKKRKVKDRKKSSSASSSPGEKQWKFDELMLVWDDVFSKACENSTVATALYELSKDGHSQYGRGCVLMQETVTTRPRGAASGFTFKSRYSSTESPELPSYSSVQWVAEYVPREFIVDPFKAPVSNPMEDGKVRVVAQGQLIQVLRGMDRTRLLGLLADPGADDLKDEGARDAGGEDPVDPAGDELVIMLVVLVDGQQAVGADVLKAFPTVEDGGSGNASGLWTLTLRDGLAD